MDDEKLKEVLTRYCQEVITANGKEEQKEQNHVFSKSFKKNIYKIIKKEQYYTKYPKVVQVIKFAIIIFFASVLLITVGYVSAAITSLNPWNFIINHKEGYVNIKNIELKKEKKY